MPNSRRTTAKTSMAKLAELSVAAPQVIAHRVTRMALSGASPNARDRKEFTGMVVEKQMANAQAWTNMFMEGLRLQQQLALNMLVPASSKQRSAQARAAATRVAAAGLAPFHSKAVANAKRLAKTRLR
jgi:hypothetical protein